MEDIIVRPEEEKDYREVEEITRAAKKRNNSRHIICSKAIVKMENRKLSVLNFGPLSVQPEYQRYQMPKVIIILHLWLWN